jgi:hypothetical protein
MSNNPLILSLIKELVKEALDFNNDKTFTPPQDVIASAKLALDTVSPQSMSEENKGNGANKARQLAAGKTQTFAQMKRLKSFFDTESKSNDRNEAAWKLHGGDKAYAWVTRELKRLNASNLRSKSTARMMGGAGKNKGMGTFDRAMMDPTNTRERSAWSAIKNREQNS